MMGKTLPPRPPGGIARGLAQNGPALWSYGFRPFFLGAAAWAVLSILPWLAALAGFFSLGGAHGPTLWHAHEMLFGFAPAVLTGYLMTAVPNWTGRMPLSGWPLACLFVLWCVGRLALLHDGSALPAAIMVEASFLPAVAFFCGREIVTGRKWRDLKLVVILLLLALANGFFHATALSGADATPVLRAAIALYVLLIAVVGGRIVPSFTWGVLKKQPAATMPAGFGTVDRLAVGLCLPALAGWVLLPQHPLTAACALAAAAAHGARLARWRGWQLRDPLLLSMHMAYACLVLGLAAIGLGALEIVPSSFATHILTIGAIAGMMMAVMMRATRGHTGKAISGTRTSGLACGGLFAAALLRPLADLWPGGPLPLYLAAGAGFIVAFGLFLVEYGPMLLFARRTPRA